ncbi:MAG: hypothetical protein PHV59_12325, partial [Victivallales bacterium]|nr:hypothetical protein [Victivallales bacterium]
ELLVNYKWPGNVREQINVVERALLLCDGDTITTVEIPDDIIGDKTKTISDLPAAVNCLAADWTSLPWKTVKNKIRDAVESKYFNELLKKYGGKIPPAAKAAGVTPRAFYQKLSRHALL